MIKSRVSVEELQKRFNLPALVQLAESALNALEPSLRKRLLDDHLARLSGPALTEREQADREARRADACTEKHHVFAADCKAGDACGCGAFVCNESVRGMVRAKGSP